MSNHPTPLSGTYSDRFESMRETFASKLESEGSPLGVVVAFGRARPRGREALDRCHGVRVTAIR